MESELEKLRRANAELQAWVRDLLVENRTLRDRLSVDAPASMDGAPEAARALAAACPAAA